MMAEGEVGRIWVTLMILRSYLDERHRGGVGVESGTRSVRPGSKARLDRVHAV